MYINLCNLLSLWSPSAQSCDVNFEPGNKMIWYWRYWEMGWKREQITRSLSFVGDMKDFNHQVHTWSVASYRAREVLRCSQPSIERMTPSLVSPRKTEKGRSPLLGRKGWNCAILEPKKVTWNSKCRWLTVVSTVKGSKKTPILVFFRSIIVWNWLTNLPDIPYKNNALRHRFTQKAIKCNEFRIPSYSLPNNRDQNHFGRCLVLGKHWWVQIVWWPVLRSYQSTNGMSFKRVST